MKLPILFSLFAMVVSSSLPNQRTLAGEDTTIIVIPYQVSIQYLGHVCSGSVIAPDWVLTAASCVVGLTEQATNIRWGSTYHQYDGSLAIIEKFHINPDYDQYSFLGNIALIKTRQAMNVRPVELANVSYPTLTGLPMVISGWGITSLNGQLSSSLKNATLPFISLANCQPYYATLDINLPSDIFCAGDATNGGACICRRDFGGPVTYMLAKKDGGDGVRRLYGVSSLSLSCGSVGQPSVFTDVRPYRSWIKHVSGV